MKLVNLTLIYAVQYKGMYVNVMSTAHQAIFYCRKRVMCSEKIT